MLRGSFEDFFDHAGQVLHVDGRHEVLAFTNDWQLLGVLFPCTLEVVVEDGFSKSVKDTSRDDISLHVLLLEVQDADFDLLNTGILTRCTTLEVVLLCEGVMQVALSLHDLLLLFLDSRLILGLFSTFSFCTLLTFRFLVSASDTI